MPKIRKREPRDDPFVPLDGDAIWNLRQRMKMTQKQLAEVLGHLHLQSVAQFESNDRPIPIGTQIQLECLIRLCRLMYTDLPRK